MPNTPVMALGAGVCSAVAMFSIVFGGLLALPLVYFASLPMYMAGLGIGVKGAMLALCAAVIAAGLLGGVYMALPMALAYGFPVVVAIRQAMITVPGSGGQPVWAPVGNVVGGLTALGIAALFFLGMVTMMDAGVPTLYGAVVGFLEQWMTAMYGDMPLDAREAVTGTLAPFFPGMAAASWVVMHVVNAAAAQGIVARSGRNVRPTPAYSNLVLPDWCSWALVISGLMAVALPGDWAYLGRNLVIVALVPFFLSGLALVHTFANRTNSATLLLVSFYIIILVLGWATFLVAVLGVIEQWVGLRKRIDPNINKENE